MSRLEQTARHWNAEGAWQVGRGIYWAELASVQRRLNRKVSGQPDVDWVRHTLETHFDGRLPVDRCLSLGCGRGGLERRLAALDAFAACDALDIAEQAIADARELAERAGHDHINYSVQDANRMKLGAGSYDAVWTEGALHHFEHLEHVFEQVSAALKPGGLFVVNEYVGPNRFQFPARQREIIQACHELLPDRCRLLSQEVLERRQRARSHDLRSLPRRVIAKLRDGDLLPAISRRVRRLLAAGDNSPPLKVHPGLPTARSVEAVDPSEAVRSAEIVPLLRRYFEIVDFRPLGGSILQFLLADIAGNFEDEVGDHFLQMLFAIEDTLMLVGELDSDFAYIVATPLPRTTDDRARR
jgi:ubiquinone/menaquinone biosynthesis C-methylase UbiE